MGLAELKQQALALPADEQAELATCLLQTLRAIDPARAEELTKLLDDREPKNWVRWRDLKEEAVD